MSDEKREERNRKRRVAYKMKADKENMSAAEHEDYNEHTSLHVSGTWSIIINGFRGYSIITFCF